MAIYEHSLWVLRSLNIGLILASSPTTSHAQTILHAWNGVSQTGIDSFGKSMAGLGDVDGDGAPDIGIGAESTNIGGMLAIGRVYLYSGRTGQQLFVLSGSQEFQFYGNSVVGPGDMNDDGQADFVIGAPSSIPWLQLYSGQNGSFLQSFSSHPLAAAPGDVNQDGVPDLLLGHPNATVTGLQAVGKADLVSGKDGTVLYSFTGSREFHGFGTPRAARDVDADGVPDLLLGAPGIWQRSGGDGVSAYSGQTGGLVFHVPPPPGSSTFPLAFDGIGDVNGDGFDDVAVHDRGSLINPPYYHVNVYGGPDGRILFRLQDPSPPANSFGEGLAGPGDVDGDGHDDILIGAGGEVFLFSGRDQSVLLKLEGQVSANTTGVGPWVARAGDVDLDDFPDLLVGGITDPTRGVLVVHLYAGAPDGVTAFGLGCPDSRGIIPRIGQTRAAALGTTFALNVSRTEPGRTALLLLGTSNTRWGHTPLPFDLGLLGVPNCSMLVSADVVTALTTQGIAAGKGWATVPLTVPQNPVLAGGRFFAQWLVPDPSGSAVTRGLEITVQP